MLALEAGRVIIARDQVPLAVIQLGQDVQVRVADCRGDIQGHRAGARQEREVVLVRRPLDDAFATHGGAGDGQRRCRGN